MKTIVLRSVNNTFRVEVKVDLFDTSESFTVMAVEGASDLEVRNLTPEEITDIDRSVAVLVADIRELPSSIPQYTDYAISNSLLMDIVDIDPAVATINSVEAADLTPSGNTLDITTSTMAGGNDTVAYSEQIATEGGTGLLTYALSAGSLPSGLTLDTATGIISGTPDTVENPTFEITVTDEFGQTEVDATMSINIAA